MKHKTHNKITQQYAKFLSILLATLLLIGMNYYTLNIGGDSLRLPFNNITWIFVSLIIGLAGFKIARIKNKLIFPKIAIPLFIFFGLIIFSAIANLFDNNNNTLFFRLSAIILLLLFFLALHQFELSKHQQQRILYLIFLSGLIQGIYGLLQLHLPANAQSFFPIPFTGDLVGIFQQRNVFAIYMATVIVIGLYLILNYDFKQFSETKQSLIVIGLAIFVYHFSKSYSLSGTVTTLIAVSILCSCHIKKLKFRFINKKKLALFIGVLVVLSLMGHVKTEKTVVSNISTKLSNFDRQYVSSSVGRWYMAENSLDLFLEKPIFGHGIGKFPLKYVMHPKAKATASAITHPHNETIFWLVEGGLIVVIGLLILTISTVYFALKLGWKTGGQYIALLFPLAFHTQVSYPFYFSAIHAVVFIYLLYLLSSHYQKTIKLNKFNNKNKSILQGVKIFSIALPVVTAVLMIHTLLSYEYVKKHRLTGYQWPDLLAMPLDNPYWYSLVKPIQMEHLLRKAKREKDVAFFIEYEKWARNYLDKVEKNPRMYINLAIALESQAKMPQAISIVNEGLKIFPNTTGLLKMQRFNQKFIEKF